MELTKFGNDKEIIVFMHYPPISKAGLSNGYTRKYIEILKEYGVKKSAIMVIYMVLHIMKQ